MGANSIRMANGSYFPATVEPTHLKKHKVRRRRVHTDASLNTQSDKNLDVVGYSYCYEVKNPVNDVPEFNHGTAVVPHNNSSLIAELLGMVFVLETAKKPDNLEILCDNMDAVDLFNYVIKGNPVANLNANSAIVKALRKLEKYQGRNICARWEKGHAGNPYNSLADHLARMGRRMKQQRLNHYYRESQEALGKRIFKELATA